MKLLLKIIVLLILIENVNALIINEIMADPIADESLNEWIELYNNESTSINVSNWLIGDATGNDTIEGGLYNNEGTIIGPFGFAIITDDSTRVYNNFNVSENAVRLYVDDGSIGNGLKNSGETIYLYDNNSNLVDEKSYNSTTEGLSWAFVNETLLKSDPTPGFSNNGSVIVESSCDYAVNFILAKTLFDNSSDFSFKVRTSKISGTATNFTMRAKIEDFNSKPIKEYKPFTNKSITTQRTSTEYTPNLEEGKSFILDSNTTTQCNDTNLNNNFDTQIITIKGKPLQEKSSIDIERVYDLGNDKEAKFGQTIRIKLNAYKGNTNKQSIAVWIEGNGDRISKQSKTNLNQKYTNYSLTLPIQIKPNCNGEFDDDDYKIKASGLDSEDEEEIEVAGITDSLCETIKVEDKKITTKNFDFELKDFNEVIEVGEDFDTKLLLDNNNDQGMKVKVWSYVYRGSKSYSGEREDNMMELVLDANSVQVIDLENMVPEAEPGNYKFKVLVNKDDQKTNNEITKDIVIKNNQNKNNNIDTNNNRNNEITFDIENKNAITGNVVNYGLVYESSTEKARHLVPIFLIILSVILNIVLISRR